MKQDNYIIQGLVKRRNELLGDIAHLETRIIELKGDIGHIDGSLRAFGYIDNERDIKPRQSPTAGIFRPRELPRLVIAQLRASNKPITGFEIGKAICRDKGWDATNQVFLDALAEKIRRVLDKLNDKGQVRKEIRKHRGFWSIV